MDEILITSYTNSYDNKYSFKNLDFCFVCNNILTCHKDFLKITMQLGEDEVDNPENLVKVF